MDIKEIKLKLKEDHACVATAKSIATYLNNIECPVENVSESMLPEMAKSILQHQSDLAAKTDTLSRQLAVKSDQLAKPKTVLDLNAQPIQSVEMPTEGGLANRVSEDNSDRLLQLQFEIGERTKQRTAEKFLQHQKVFEDQQKQLLGFIEGFNSSLFGIE